MWPRVSKISEESRTASLKSLVMDVSAARNRFLKEARQQGRIFGEGDDAVANIARRQHVEFLAQPPAGAAIIADRDHGAKFVDLKTARLLRGAGPGDITFEPLQQGRQTGAATNRNDIQGARGTFGAQLAARGALWTW